VPLGDDDAPLELAPFFLCLPLLVPDAELLPEVPVPDAPAVSPLEPDVPLALVPVAPAELPPPVPPVPPDVLPAAPAVVSLLPPLVAPELVPLVPPLGVVEPEPLVPLALVPLPEVPDWPLLSLLLHATANASASASRDVKKSLFMEAPCFIATKRGLQIRE
jgi:hypothetical protein